MKILWEYGTCKGRDGVVRRHRITGKVEFVLWKAGEQGHNEDCWHEMGFGWEDSFVKDAKQPTDPHLLSGDKKKMVKLCTACKKHSRPDGRISMCSHEVSLVDGGPRYQCEIYRYPILFGGCGQSGRYWEEQKSNETP